MVGASAVIAAGVFASSSASASVISFTQQFVWQFYTNSQGAAISSESFNGIADGFYASPFSSTTGSVQWTATASGGLFVQGGQFSTNLSSPLTFTFGPNVQGVGGNFYGTDVAFNTVPSVVTITLADGSGYVGYVDATASFTGFYSTGAAITSLTVSAVSVPPGSTVYPTVDNIHFAVIPAPSALALGALGIAAGQRRRRR